MILIYLISVLIVSFLWFIVFRLLVQTDSVSNFTMKILSSDVRLKKTENWVSDSNNDETLQGFKGDIKKSI